MSLSSISAVRAHVSYAASTGGCRVSSFAVDLIENKFASRPHSVEPWIGLPYPHYPQRRLSIMEIVDICGSEFCLTRRGMLCKERGSAYVTPRHIAMYLARKLTRKSTTQIGRVMHRDHSSVINGIERMSDRVKADARFAARVAALEAKILGE